MIVLDTNVVSEAMKPEPSAAVQAWLDAQAAETLYLTSIAVAELSFGVAALPDGRRLAFGTDAARRYADLAITARKAGKGFPPPDGYIAAIAVTRGFAVATRDSSAFDAAGIPVIDPWKTGAFV